jgi:hypothetical protein
LQIPHFDVSLADLLGMGTRFYLGGLLRTTKELLMKVRREVAKTGKGETQCFL